MWPYPSGRYFHWCKWLQVPTGRNSSEINFSSSCLPTVNGPACTRQASADWTECSCFPLSFPSYHTVLYLQVPDSPDKERDWGTICSTASSQDIRRQTGDCATTQRADRDPWRYFPRPHLHETHLFFWGCFLHAWMQRARSSLSVNQCGSSDTTIKILPWFGEALLITSTKPAAFVAAGTVL